MRGNARPCRRRTPARRARRDLRFWRCWPRVRECPGSATTPAEIGWSPQWSASATKRRQPAVGPSQLPRLARRSVAGTFALNIRAKSMASARWLAQPGRDPSRSGTCAPLGRSWDGLRMRSTPSNRMNWSSYSGRPNTIDRKTCDRAAATGVRIGVPIGVRIGAPARPRPPPLDPHECVRPDTRAVNGRRGDPAHTQAVKSKTAAQSDPSRAATPAHVAPPAARPAWPLQECLTRPPRTGLPRLTCRMSAVAARASDLRTPSTCWHVARCPSWAI